MHPIFSLSIVHYFEIERTVLTATGMFSAQNDVVHAIDIL